GILFEPTIVCHYSSWRHAPYMSAGTVWMGWFSEDAASRRLRCRCNRLFVSPRAAEDWAARAHEWLAAKCFRAWQAAPPVSAAHQRHAGQDDDDAAHDPAR